MANMKVLLFDYSNFKDKNQLELDYATGSGSSIDVVGQFTCPTGHFILDLDATDSVFMLQGLWVGLFDGTKTGFNTNLVYVVKVTNITAMDGVHVMVQYEVDWLRTYYMFCLESYGRTAAGRIAAFRNPGIREIACSNNGNWNRWQNVALQTTGNYNITTIDGNIVKRMDKVKNPNQAYLVLYKNSYSEASPGTASTNGITPVMISYGELEALLSTLGDGDYTLAGTPFKGGILANFIQGIYFLPGITIDTSAHTTNMKGVSLKFDHFAASYTDANIGGTDYFCAIDPITGEAVQTLSRVGEVHIILYDQDDTTNKDAKPAYLDFAHDLSVYISDFRDIYYTQYKMYVPFIGIVDPPIRYMIDYTQNNEYINFDFQYIYDIYSGRISYRWKNLLGLPIDSWHALPNIPYSTNNATFAIQQNNAKTDLTAIGSMIGLGLSTVTGNVAGVITSGTSLTTAFAMNDLNNNAETGKHINTTNSANFDGYANTEFYLTIIRTEVIGFSEYMQTHGYPTYHADYTTNGGWTSAYCIWFDISGWSHNIYPYFIAHTDDIIKQLNNMEYVYICSST